MELHWEGSGLQPALQACFEIFIRYFVSVFTGVHKILCVTHTATNIHIFGGDMRNVALENKLHF